MSEQLCLQWNEYKENAIRTFGSLKEDKDFTDITLVCEDGKQIETHKVILANSSPFFQNILRKNKHIHPLIYMRGVKSEDLSAIVDFLYCGEAKVYQKNLDSFLAIAEELQLEGLKGHSDNNEVKQGETFEMVSPKKGKVKKEFNVLKSFDPSESNFSVQTTTKESDTVGEVVALTNHFSSGEFQELDEKCASMMEKTSVKNARGQPLYRCKVCGKEEINGAIKSHIEINHLEGVSIPCNLCEKTFRSRNNLRQHRTKEHQRY